MKHLLLSLALSALVLGQQTPTFTPASKDASNVLPADWQDTINAAIALNPAATRAAANLGNAKTFSVTDYGAAGDGTTDDVDAFQAACDAAQAAGGGVVYIPAGTFRIGPTSQALGHGHEYGIRVHSNTELRGAGKGITVLKAIDNHVGSFAIIFGVNNLGVSGGADYSGRIANITIRDMTIDGNKANRPPYAGTNVGEDEGINFYGIDGLQVLNVCIQNCLADGIDLDGISTDCDNVLISGCDFLYNNNHGCHLEASNLRVENCYFKGNFSDYTRLVGTIPNMYGAMEASQGYNQVVIGCTFEDNVIGVVSSSLQVIGCVFRNSLSYGTGSAYVLNGAHSVGATSIVVKTGTGTILTGDYINVGDYSYLVTAGVAAAGTVTIAAPGLRASGSDGNAVKVRANSVYAAYQDKSVAALFSGCYFNVFGSATAAIGINIPSATAEVLINGCRIYCAGIGVKFTSAKTVTITGSFITANNHAVELTNLNSGTFRASGSYFVGTSGNALRIDSTGAGTVSSCILESAGAPAIDLRTNPSGWHIQGNRSPSGSVFLRVFGTGTPAHYIADNDAVGSIELQNSGHRLLRNKCSTLTITSANATLSVIEGNEIVTSIVHSTATYSQNTWRGNYGAGTTGIFSGTTTLAAGASTITSAAVSANTKLTLTLKTVGGTIGGQPYVDTITAGTGLTLAGGGGSNTSVYNWSITD